MRYVMESVYRHAAQYIPELTCYVGTADSDSTLPYAVLNITGAPDADYTTDHYSSRVYSVQFSVYGTGYKQVAGYTESIREAFERETVVMSGGYSLLAVYDAGQSLENDPYYQVDGVEVWTGVQMLDLDIERKYRRV